MSRYVTGIIPQSIGAEQINALGNKYNLMFAPINNHFVEKQISIKDMKYYLIEWIENKYDIAVGYKEEADSNAGYSELLSSLFSDNKSDVILKIDEAGREKQKAIDIGINNWSRFLSKFFSENNDNKIGLLLHTYSGFIEKEQFEIKGISDIVICNLDSFCAIEHIEEDVLYMFSCKSEPDGIQKD